MTSRHRPDRVHQHQQRKPESQRDAGEPDVRTGENGATDAAENQHERSDELGSVSSHGRLPAVE